MRATRTAPVVDVRAVLGEAHHLGAGHRFADEFGDFDFEPGRQAQGLALGHLTFGRGVDLGVTVAEDDRAERERVIDVFVAVEVPDVGALGPVEKLRRGAGRPLAGGFGKGLRGAGDVFSRPLQVP